MVLLAYYALFLLAAFVLPSWRLWRRERVNALVLPRDDSAEAVIGRWFKALIVGVAALLIASAAGVQSALLVPLVSAGTGVARGAGWSLLAVSLALMVTAQARMGRSWRIGIDAGSQPPLVRSGLFARSRNPIFLALRLNLLGLLLVLPVPASLGVLLLAEALIQIQVRLEEAHLARAFGAGYDGYRRAVPRWL